jgi:hypothetical protein
MGFPSRRNLWLSAAALLAVIVGASWWLLPPRSRITQENCDKIQLGWTYEQVVDLLGDHWPYGIQGAAQAGASDEDDNYILVEFKNGRVTGKRFQPTTLSLIGRIKHRIELHKMGITPPPREAQAPGGQDQALFPKKK